MGCARTRTRFIPNTYTPIRLMIVRSHFPFPICLPARVHFCIGKTDLITNGRIRAENGYIRDTKNVLFFGAWRFCEPMGSQCSFPNSEWRSRHPGPYKKCIQKMLPFFSRTGKWASFLYYHTNNAYKNDGENGKRSINNRIGVCSITDADNPPLRTRRYMGEEEQEEQKGMSG